MTLSPPAAMAKGTLSRQLVVRTTALVAAATILLSLVTGLASFQILQAQLDGRLESALRAWGPGSFPRETKPGDPEGSGLIRIEQRGTEFIYTDVLTESQVVALAAIDPDSTPVTMAIEGLGLYRVQVSHRQGRISVAALPFSAVTTPLTRQLMMAALLTLGSIALAGFGARQVVESSLRPLRRLAGTASQVAGLPLASGEGNLPVRVPQQDADPASEVGQVGVAFNQMLDHVEAALEARHRSETKVRQFVADASHELRNPLAAIRGYAEVARRGHDQVPADVAHALRRVESESTRMTSLVDDLLLLARLDSGRPLAVESVDLTALVVDAVSDAHVAGPDHRWQLDLPDQVIRVPGDPARLHQVLANLLTNARVHTPPGSTVTTSLRLAGEVAELSVTDDGPGVPAELRAEVFERFARGDSSRSRAHGSTGLGLAIVAAVVAAHHGSVTLDSRPGRTVFTVRLPDPTLDGG